MRRQRIVGSLWLLAAMGTGLVGPRVGADGGKIIIDGVTAGRYVDPFLDGAEALVRSQGFRGDFAMLVGLSGLAGEATMCRQDCDCRETLHSAGRLQRLVAPLKGTVTRWGKGATMPESGWSALEGELQAGRPLLAEGLLGPTTLHLVIGCVPRTRTLIYLDGGKRREEAFAEWTQGNWSFCTARLGTTRLPGAKAEMEAIATMFAEARQPRIEGGCAVRADRTQNALGLEAYSLWGEQVEGMADADAETKAQRVKGWTERREMLAKFLRTAASHQQGETAEHLRDAARSVQDEVKQGLKPLAATTPYPPPAGADQKQREPALRKRQAALMQAAKSFQVQFLRKLEPVVFRHLRVPKEAQPAVSMKPSQTPPDAAVARKLLRATDARVRTLAAVAAGSSGDKTLAPELTEGLRSPDPVEARTSLAALKSVQPDNLLGLLQKQVQTMGAAGAATDGATQDTDSIQRQMRFAIEDLEQGRPLSFWRNPFAWLWRSRARWWLLGLVVAGLAVAAWKFLGPKRLGSDLEELDIVLPETPGLPPEQARLEALLARPPATGLMLTHVEAGGMAAKQGLALGDVLCSYNGVEIFGLEDLRTQIIQTGPRRRRIAGRRGLRIIKTVVPPGSLGLRGVAVTRGETFWQRLETAPFTADYSGLAEEGEGWYRFTQSGRPCGFEWRHWRWVQGELEVTSITGLMGENGEESVRVTQRLRGGERLTCLSSKFRARGQHPVEADAACTGGRWSILLNGQTVTHEIPEEAVPTQAMAIFAGTLPLQAGRAYDVVRIDECDFVPAYGYQFTCGGQEVVQGPDGEAQAWRFDLAEYGVRQMAFWFDAQRHLIRAEYAGLVSTLTTRDAALAGLPDRLRALLEENRRGRPVEAEPAAPSRVPAGPVGAGAVVAER